MTSRRIKRIERALQAGGAHGALFGNPSRRDALPTTAADRNDRRNAITCNGSPVQALRSLALHPYLP